MAPRCEMWLRSHIVKPYRHWRILLGEASSGRDVPQPIVERCSFLGVFADVSRNVAPSKPLFRSARHGHLVSLRSCLTSFVFGHRNGYASRAAAASRESQACVNVLGFGRGGVFATTCVFLDRPPASYLRCLKRHPVLPHSAVTPLSVETKWRGTMIGSIVQPAIHCKCHRPLPTPLGLSTGQISSAVERRLMRHGFRFVWSLPCRTGFPRALAVGSLRSASTPAIHGLRSGCIHAPTAHSRRPSMSRRA